MFQKPAFGSTTANFGSFNSGTTAASPFGSFKPNTGTSAFGAPPAFGAAATPQPATGGGLFGATNTTGGLFGNTAASTSTSGFGASTSGFGFGASTSTGGLFGGNTSTGLFGNTQNQSAFGAKPSGFGFGATSTTGATAGSLFGAPQTTGTGLFGQQTNTLGGGGLFSNNASAFGQPQQTASGTAHVKYNPVVGTDVIVKSGTSQNVNIKHHCITCMKEYENKSLEELRLEDYVGGRKGNTSGVFGGFQQQTETKPLFGGTTSFAQPATTSASSVFGGGGLTSTGFGQSGSFNFGSNTQNNTSTAGGLFGATKPAFGATPTTGTGLFGATTTQAGATSFGTTTPAFGFGATTQQQQTGGLFGAKPATTGFGTTPASMGFGGFGTGTGGGLFGAKSAAPTFGTAAPAFGTLGGGSFGTTTSTSGGLFGANNTFGKPATTQPTFGFNAQPTLGTGLNTGLAANSFQPKPAAPTFGALGTTNMFGQPQTAPATNFKTGLDSGLGGGMFGNTSGLGGSALGMGALNANTNPLANNSLSGSSAAGNVHEQILTLAARPYGDSPLFKDLLPDSSMTAEDVLRPTNPLAVQAVLDSSSISAYRVTSPSALALKLQPKPTLTQDKVTCHTTNLLAVQAVLDSSSISAYRVTSPSALALKLQPKPTLTQDKVTCHTTNLLAVQAVLDSSSISAYRVTSPSALALKLQPKPTLTQDKVTCHTTNLLAVQAVLDSSSISAYRVTSPSALALKLQPKPTLTQDKVTCHTTNPLAVQAVLDSSSISAYRVTSPSALALKLQPKPTLTQDKKSLFDGLEESDASLEDKLCLKPSRKRLVLRPNQMNDHHDSIEHTNEAERSIEEPLQSNGPSHLHSERVREKEAPVEIANTDEVDRARRQVNFNDNNADVSSDRHGSWLSASKVSWTEKEKQIETESTPRLYPNIDKDIQQQVSERRASWLTTKPLRKPLVSNPDSAENSVRELGVRADRSHDKENVDTLSVSEEENVSPREAAPHPTGVKLTRPGYYTIPSLDEMIGYIRPDGSCVVPHLTIGRKNYGNVYYDCEIDVTGMDLDKLVHFLNKEVIVYPEDSEKPPLGSGLNRRAIVTLDRVWPRDKTERRPITEPDRILKMDYEGKLRRVCDKHDTKFIEYRPATGSWVFRVEHFSKYGLSDSDEEEHVPDVVRRQLQRQALQGDAPVSKPPVSAAPGLGGLGGLGAGLSTGLAGGLGGLGGLIPDENMFAMQQSTVNLNLMNGSKAFEMDTTEDNNNEAQSLYMDNRAYGVKSPTSELARLEHRQSHNVQLMKASLYADTEMDDAASVSTGDQLVPVSAPPLSLTSRAASLVQDNMDMLASETPQQEQDEIALKPLIIRPHTIVLKYHRKVLPFKQTIAGRLGAAYIADMSVCRARHARAGFGPGGALAYATTYDSVTDLPPSAELSELGKYVQGRSSNDWSEPVVVRMALGQADKNDGMQEMLKLHLATLLEHSTLTEAAEERCPQLVVSREPREREAILHQYLKQSAKFNSSNKFGVSAAYCHEVWRLCDALWGQDLENEGVPSTDPLSTVNRHKKLLEWLKTAVADVTDHELSRPQSGEEQDEADGHSAQIWTLLLGGRILEACKLAKEHGDLNMATLIAQAAGDPTFRSLISRQLSLWRECGAEGLISSHRWATLQLIAGQSTPRDKLVDADWLRALHVTARYLCPHIPSLEQVMRKYEGFFMTGDRDADEIDLSLVTDTSMDMKLPLPPYVNEYDVTIDQNGSQRRVLDLRYSLIRARAFNDRPKLTPAAYTPDPMDYSLCFLLGAWFGSPSVESITGVADQLEAAGAWHLAVQALAYHPNEMARGHLIRAVVSRHAPSRAASPEAAAQLELIKKLGVPHKWLLLAQAHRAKYEHLPALEAEHLVGAGQWNAAHKVLLDELLPEAVLADDLQSIASLLDRMNEAAARHEVSGWESGGQALHHYLHVCDEIRGLVSEAEAEGEAATGGGMHARLEALRPRVAAACRALGGLQPKSARAMAARAEMGGRLVQLSLAAGEPPAHTAQLLRTLRLPPDTTPHAHHKISTLLAERASTPPSICAT